MTWEPGPEPLLSVVIPTFGNSPLLRQSLASLAAQRIDPRCFEVVVTDDASGQDILAVTESFADRLTVRTRAQPTRRFRAANRNLGAEIARAPILAFIDQGVTVGPDFVAAYLSAHLAADEGGEARAFIGYTPGYDLAGSRPGLADLLTRRSPSEVLDHYATTDPLLDMRHAQYERIGFDLDRLHAPWALFWTVNVSVRRADYWRVGGFDEGFQAWGVEDVEFAYRLAVNGVRLHLARQAWAIDGPHDRDMKANRRASFVNAERFWQLHHTLETELYWSVYGSWHGFVLSLEDEYGALLDWTGKAHRDVCAEVEQALRDLPRDHRVAVLGCGSRLPRDNRIRAAIDFDRELLAGHSDLDVRHAIGIRTDFPDASFDTVLITSRLSGLRELWQELALTESRRIATDVRP